MSDLSLTQLSLFDNRPLPLIVAEKWQFPLQHYEPSTQFAKYHFSAQDWLIGLGLSKRSAEDFWLKKGVQFETVSLPYETKGGQQTSDFATDKTLYLIAQEMRLTKRNPQLADIRQYLANAGAFVDAKRIEAQQAAQIEAHSKEYYGLLNEGFSEIEAEQVIRERATLSDVFKDVTATWQKHGAVGWDYAVLRNIWSEVLTGKSATQIKRDMGLDDSPWNYDSALDLVLNQILAIVARGYHDQRQSKGREALAKDIRDTKPAVDSMRGILSEQFSDRKRQPRLPKPTQPALPEGKSYYDREDK